MKFHPSTIWTGSWMMDKGQTSVALVLDAVGLLSPYCAVNVLFRSLAKSRLCFKFRFSVFLTLDKVLARKEEGCGWSGGVYFF